MRNLKKVLSLVLCMAMMLSVMVVGAGAAFKDQSKIVNEEAVDMCSALNIINGYTDGSFKPEGTITRAEACKMICVALNGGKEPVLGTNATASFTDIKGHWAEGYIEYCVAEGIVAGIGGGKFNPNGNVTGSQFAKMLLIALGYRADHEKFVGNAWEVNVNVKATQKGLYEDLETMDVSAALTRDNAAQMVWNALQAMQVKYEYTLVSENGQLVSKVTVKDDKEAGTLLSDKYGVIDDESGIMTYFTYNEDKGEWTYYFGKLPSQPEQRVAANETASNGNLGYESFISDVDYTDLFRQNVKVVYTEKNNKVDTVYGMFAYESSVIAEGVLGDIDAADLGDNSIEIADVDYDTTNDTVDSYAFNGAADPDITADYEVPASDLGYSMKAIDNTGDDKIDVIVYVPFTVEEVTYVGATTITTDGTGNVKIENINLADGVAKDDYVMIVDKANTVDGVAAYTELNILSGKVASVKGSDVKVDGTWYTLANDVEMTLGNEYDFVVVAGYVYAAVATTSDIDLSDYAVVTKAQNGASWDADNSKSVLLFADGTSKTIAVEEADKAIVNELVTFEIDDEVYDLTNATTDTNEKSDNYCGFDFAAKNTTYDVNNDKFAFGEKKFSVADDAVIFLKVLNKDNTIDEYKVITGADLKEMDSVKTVLNAYANEDDATGFTNVVMAFVSTYSTDSSKDAVYGYVVDDVADVEDKDGKTVYEITLGDGTVLTTKYGTAANTAAQNLTKGAVVSYELTDGLVKTLKVIGDTNGDDQKGAVAITAYNGKLLQVTGADANKTFEITNETEIIYINSKTTSVAEGGSIALAQKDSNKNPVVNAIYDCTAKAANDDGYWELDLLVVDVNNNIYDATIN